MLPFLLWSAPEQDRALAPGRVSERFERILAPLFSRRPKLRSLRQGEVNLIYYELPVSGWLPAAEQHDERTTAVAIAFPRNGPALVAPRGPRAAPENCLPRLARRLQQHGAALLREIPPPMLLFWIDRQTGLSYLVNDGLGHAQLFEASRSGTVALSNRIFCFRALDIPLEPVAEQWALKCTLGWFPLDFSGFEAVRYADPGTLYRWGPEGIARRRLHVLADWVQRDPEPDAQCLERARQSLAGYIRDTRPLFSKASGGLTGGFDSRAIFATYRHLGLQLRARVKGHANHHDVVVARKLAAVAGLNLTVKHEAELPPESASDLSRSIRAALLWQAGHIDTPKLITFAPRRRGMAPGIVNVMGLDGVIGRAFFARQIRAATLAKHRYEDELVKWFTRRLPPYLRPDLRKRLAERFRAAYRQGHSHGLDGDKRLDFLYLFERTRRWSSGAQAAQSGIVLTPFLNPEFIRAVYSYRGAGMEDNVFHRHIIARHAPDWADVVYEKQLRRQSAANPASAASAKERADWMRTDARHYFDRQRYWRHVGRPLLQACLEKGRFWRKIFDPRTLPRDAVAADELAMLFELEKLIRD